MTVSLVTYRHPLAAVRAVVDAVMKSGNVERFYVIDNAGETGLRAELAAVYPQIEYIPLDNPGFGAAHNVAIRKAMEAGSKYHAVVNPDIDFEPGTLEKIAAFMDENGDVGLVMPKTVDPDGTMQYNAKLLPTPWDSFGRRFLPKSWTTRRNRRYELRDANHERTFDCGYLCGCFLVFRLECLKEVGLFDERYFMYPEDIDISRRVYASRWRSVYFAEAEVMHAHEAASYKNWRMTWIHIKNMVKYYNKWGWFLDAERQRVNREVWAAAMKKLMLVMFALVALTGQSTAAINETEAGIDGPREGEFSVVLDVSRPVAGKAMKATVTGERTGNVTFAWFVREPSGAYGDAVCEGREYAPTAADYEHWIRVTATDEEGAMESTEFYFSKLPIVYINTDDGEAVTSKEEYKGATIRIQGNDLYDQQYDGKMEIKGRGNTSWGYPKKPYKLKLGKKADLFGFGKNKHWVLLSNWLDECFMRNYLAQDLAGTLGLVKDEMTWVNVVFNGEYQGNYMLAEHIRVDENRINIFDWSDIIESDGHSEEDLSWLDEEGGVDVSGGYIFELSAEYDEVSKFTTGRGLKVMVNTPEYAATSQKMMDYMVGLWGDYENAYCAEDGYNAKGVHYSEIANMASLASYWLVMEALGNNDAIYKSRYAYKDKGGKLLWGPAWDFDWGCGSVAVGLSSTGWKVSKQNQESNMNRELLDDPYFCMSALERYWEFVRPWLDRLLDDGGYLSFSNYLAEAGMSDDLKWGPTNGQNAYFTRKSWAGGAQRGFAGDVVAFREYLQSRAEWLDAQFLSVDKLMASVKTSTSSCPYEKDDSALSILLGNGENAGETDAKTDFVLNRGEEEPQVRVTVPNGAIIKLHAYVNGLKYGIYDVADGKCEFTVSADRMVAERGHRDMVSLIAKDADGKTIARNYLTILNPPIPPAFTIDFDSNGGTPVASVTNEYGAAISAPTPPTRTGYALAGWYESGAANPFVFSTMPARDVFLTAHWTLDGWEAISGAKVAIETGLIGYKASGLPKGLTYNKTTGKITGTATKSGEFVVAFTKNGETPREKMIAVRAEKVSVGCEGLAAGPLPAGVGTSGGIDIQIDDESGTKSVSVTKLPAGMKYDSKSGKITGAPSRAGDYEAVLTVTTKYGAKETVRIPVSVTAMPETAVGAFNGFVLAGGETLGTFALTTTAAGRLTAKVVTAAGTVSFSGTSWDSVEKGVYRATLLTKSGERLTLTLDSTAAWDANQLSGEFRMSAVATYSVSAQRNAFGKAWHFSATGDAEAGWTFSYAEDAKAAALTVTLRADGSTAIAGKLPNGKDAKGKDVAIKVSASGSANVGGLRDGAVLADFAPVLTVGGKKKALAIGVNLWFDRKNDHASGVGEARFAD